METELLEESPKANIHTDWLKVTLKKIANWKIPCLDSILGFWF